jgi:tRNA threonylcarbamoyladenosine modification (KEOPS) complex  Pcc1 subunit
MKARATIRMKVPSQKKLQIILSSLKPELGAISNKRSRVNIDKEDDCLILKVESKDTAALRAALNSYLRWINSILNIFETVERLETSSKTQSLKSSQAA